MRLTIVVIFVVQLSIPLAAQQRDIGVSGANITLGTGFFSDNLDWSIAGNSNGEDPNILSELKWTRQEGPLAEIGVQIGVRSFFAESGFTYQRTFCGQVSDSDFGEDDRERRVFNIVLPTRKGSLYSTSLGAGYYLQSGKKTGFKLSAGVSRRSMTLFLSDQSSNLNSSYAPEWKGWYLKAILVKQLGKVYYLNIGIAYHQQIYTAKANWDLIEEFEHPVSFRHKAKGLGFDCKPSLNAWISKKISLSLSAEAYLWQTGRGTDELFFKNGKTAITQLNEVNLKGFTIKTGFNYIF
ncbi:hypothetical protein [Desertivirga brevis]|uniref:hypothetical protein n=1 Tax=Desertivirga brevis TaxID=2810310 RepID=UPI001A978756|nr:hypothetical protein [Pedobacter sp. SYSU D00873]